MSRCVVGVGRRCTRVVARLAQGQLPDNCCASGEHANLNQPFSTLYSQPGGREHSAQQQHRQRAAAPAEGSSGWPSRQHASSAAEAADGGGGDAPDALTQELAAKIRARPPVFR
jgi:hypothetical protein